MGLSQNMKLRVPAIRLGRAVFRCGYPPDMLAVLQANPVTPTPFFSSVRTLDLLAILSYRTPGLAVPPAECRLLISTADGK